MSQNSEDQLIHLFKTLSADASPLENLRYLADNYPGKVTFSTSFSEEDQIITHLIFTEKLKINVFTLDTGRLFPETYSTWNQTVDKYQSAITTYYPQADAIEAYVSEKGPNAFYESVALRKQCCQIRKVQPLQRAIANYQIWITGIRAEHSPNRVDMPFIEWDGQNQITKIHPLLNWKQTEVQQYIEEHNIPVNPLHQKGMVSIGCAPCTRAIKPGEDFRAGRWWWEDGSKKECGLHTHNQQ